MKQVNPLSPRPALGHLASTELLMRSWWVACLLDGWANAEQRSGANLPALVNSVFLMTTQGWCRSDISLGTARCGSSLSRNAWNEQYWRRRPGGVEAPFRKATAPWSREFGWESTLQGQTHSDVRLLAGSTVGYRFWGSPEQRLRGAVGPCASLHFGLSPCQQALWCCLRNNKNGGKINTILRSE